MGRLFNYNSSFFRFLRTLANLFFVNLLWLLCCIPVITIVPSTAALYYVTLKMVRKEDPPIVKSFFHSFRDNLKQGIVLTLIFLVLGAFLYIDHYVASGLTNTFGKIMQVFFTFLGIVYFMILTYSIPLLAQFENTIGRNLKNAFLLSVVNLGRTVIILIAHAVPFVVLLFFLKFFLSIFPLWFLLAPSVIAYICAGQLKKAFDPLIAAQEEPEQDQ